MCIPKEGPACAIAGGSGGAVDPKTHRKFVWAFIYAIADAESIVVSLVFLLMGLFSILSSLTTCVFVFILAL